MVFEQVACVPSYFALGVSLSHFIRCCSTLFRRTLGGSE